MKKLKIFSMLAIFTSLSLLTSCNSHNPDEISSKEIVKEFNNKLKETAADIKTISIKVGTYECNDNSERELLRKLQAAELITYDVVRYAWWEKEVKNSKKSYTSYETYYGWYYSYRSPVTKSKWVKSVNYNFEDHYIVTVALTEKGQKIVDETTPEPVVDKDMEQPEINTEEYAWNVADLSEYWPEIENPFLVKEETKEVADVVAPKKETPRTQIKDERVEPKEVEEGDKIERIKKEQYEKYRAFEESCTIVKLLACKFEAVKARNIRIFKDEKGYTKATAEVIIEAEDVTDAGRIALGYENKVKTQKEVSLTYYCDKGWVIDKDTDTSVEINVNEILSAAEAVNPEEVAVMDCGL